ncbi:hypothetical protein GCM10011342_01800 [Aquisalinus flavus]|uniref:Uncharacterized protein n=1 Tax=Aquisalinus flavus TaxID=1526572 RepID=A0A8J2V3S6_9PROT|nr:hypothetical protein GCM10011342_01800 [Aquisalinus flavus]
MHDEFHERIPCPGGVGRAEYLDWAFWQIVTDIIPRLACIRLKRTVLIRYGGVLSQSEIDLLQGQRQITISARLGKDDPILAGRKFYQGISAQLPAAFDFFRFHRP